MPSENPVDTDKATVGGYWVGVGGLLVGLAGLGFTIYTAFKTPTVALFAGSGWVAALFVGLVAERIGRRLVGALSQLQREYRDRVDRDAAQISRLETELSIARDVASRAIDVSEFVAAKSVRQQPISRSKPTSKDIEAKE